MEAGQAPGAGEVGRARRLVQVKAPAPSVHGIRWRHLAGQAAVVLQPVRLRLLLLLLLLLLLQAGLLQLLMLLLRVLRALLLR